ncbi:MAG TPA: IS30 family transposase [Xanthomonadaceae bacterium]
MAKERRTRLNAEQRRWLWNRWREGDSIAEIARGLDRFPGTVRDVLEARGGISPRERRRSDRALSLAEREGISRGLAQGQSLRRIAAELGRSASTISREVKRHGGPERYRAEGADKRAWKNAQRLKACVLVANLRLQRMVAAKLRRDWSPEQIARWLKLAFPGDETMHVSHETIYRSLYVQARGALKKELLGHLRYHRLMRQAKVVRSEGGRGKILDAVSISERPATADDRAVPGHWEGDLLAGGKNSYIATLVERQTRYVMLVKVDDKQTQTVVPALKRVVRRLPAELRQSLTWDRGKELSRHKDFSMATDMPVYFCAPYSPWQRGSNENTNGLLRQYFPKGMDLSPFTQRQLDKIARQLNERPRKTLGFLTPAQKLQQTVAMTG